MCVEVTHKYPGTSICSWIRVLEVMENASQDSKSINLSDLREALLSSSTNRRGNGLASLRQQIVQSGKSRERTFIDVAECLQNCQSSPVPRLPISSS